MNLTIVLKKKAASIGDALLKAEASALNKTAAKASTFASREIREDYNVKASTIRSKISVFRATSFRLTAKVRASSSRISLSEFSPRPSRVTNPRPARGISVEVRRGERRVVRGAFLANPSGKYLSLFRRVGRSRLPLKFLTSLSVTQMFSTRNMQGKIKDFISDNLKQQLDHELDFYLIGRL